MRVGGAVFVSILCWTSFAQGASVSPVQMIEIDVQVLEVNRTKLSEVGLDWVRLLEGGPLLSSPVSPMNLLEQGPTSLKRVGTFERGQVDLFVRILQENNYGKLLAKPKLLTADGAVASFLVGGEIPVVNQDSQGRTSVTWKEYGVKLKIQPRRRGDSIRTILRAEASTVDPSNAVRLPNGTYMPALRTRWVETDVELKNGATVIIAGLIQTEEMSIKVGVPVLSSIPLLGWLFRHTRTENIETELVIFVTPSLVSPQSGAAGE